MRNELLQLGPDGFERLIQSLLAGETYGDGPDGQRECVIRDAKRLLALPDLRVSGYLMAQVKFKSPEGAAKDWPWLQNNLRAELEGFRAKARENEKLKAAGKEDEIYRLPETWLLVTNLVLTPAQNTGLKDKADRLAEQYRDLIPRIYILGADDVRTMLDNRPMVAAAYSALSNDGLRSHRALRSYVRLCFSDHANVDLKQAGDETGQPVDLRNVYTDLSVQLENETRSFSELIVGRSERLFSIIEEGEDSGRILRSSHALLAHAKLHGHITTRFTLLGEAGRGKSTVCRLLCQIFRAALLREERDAPPAAMAYLETPEGTEALPIPRYSRIPVTVTLKDFAAWLRESPSETRDLLSYLLRKINDRTNAQLSADDLLMLFRSEAWFFCFDGLDEVPAASNRRLVVEQLTGFLGMLDQLNCNSLSVLTSRPQGYDDPALLQRFKQITLLPMEPERCMGYLGRLLPHLEQDPEERVAKLRIMQNALQDPLTAKLMETPLYATILLILARSGGRLPSRRYDLFKEYCETVTRRERQKGLLTDLEGSYNWVLQVHREIGLLLQRESNTKENAAAELTLDRLEALLSEYLTRQDIEEEPQTRVNALRDSLTRRLPFLAQTTNAEGQACVLFPLRSIQEYYAAEGILAQPDQNKLGNALKEISRSAYWRNVFLFVAGCLTGDLDRYDLLNDRLYTICRMNNGDPDHCGEQKARELYALTNLGSRLALDLLREGIFSRRLDKERYCALLEPLLRETVTVTQPLASPVILGLTELPRELLKRLLDGVLVPLLQETGDGDCLGFTLLWVLANGEEAVPEAAEALAKLLPEMRFAGESTCLRLINGGYASASPSVREGLYVLAEATLGRNPGFISHISPIQIREFARYLACTARDKAWTRLPDAMLRSFLYAVFRYFSRFGRFEELAETEPELIGKAGQISQALFTDRIWSEDSCFMYAPAFPKNGIPEELPAYLEALRSRQLSDLAALLTLQADPGPAASRAVLGAWSALDQGFKPLFLEVLRRGSWYCRRLGAALARGAAAEDGLLPRGEIEAREERLRVWLADPAAAIRAGQWEEEIRCVLIGNDTGYAEKPQLELSELLPLLRSRPLRREHWELVDFLTDGMNRLPPELTDFLLERLPELEGAEACGRLLLRLFLELPGDALLQGRFPWPKELPLRGGVLVSMPPERLSGIVSRLQALTANPGLAVWEACAMLPYLAQVYNVEALIPLPKGCYASIQQTGNPAACLGGILALLCGEPEAGDCASMAEDLRRFLSDPNSHGLFEWSSRYFSAQGQYFLYQLARELEPAGETRQGSLSDLMDTCISGLRGNLENAPACLRAI